MVPGCVCKVEDVIARPSSCHANQVANDVTKSSSAKTRPLHFQLPPLLSNLDTNHQHTNNDNRLIYSTHQSNNIMSGEEVPKIPSIELSQNRFLLTSGPKETHAQAQEAILQKIKEDSTLAQMGGGYHSLMRYISANTSAFTFSRYGTVLRAHLRRTKVANRCESPEENAG